MEKYKIHEIHQQKCICILYVSYKDYACLFGWLVVCLFVWLVGWLVVCVSVPSAPVRRSAKFLPPLRSPTCDWTHWRPAERENPAGQLPLSGWLLS